MTDTNTIVNILNDDLGNLLDVHRTTVDKILDRTEQRILDLAKEQFAAGVAEGRRQRDEEIKREVFTSARQVAEEAGFAPVPEQVIVSYTQQVGAYEQGIYDAGITEGRRQAAEEQPPYERGNDCPTCGSTWDGADRD